MCSPATSESFDQPQGNTAALLRTEAHSSQAAGRHRSAATPALATSYYPQPVPLSLMYPYMGAGALDGERALLFKQTLMSCSETYVGGIDRSTCTSSGTVVLGMLELRGLLRARGE